MLREHEFMRQLIDLCTRFGYTLSVDSRESEIQVRNANSRHVASFEEVGHTGSCGFRRLELSAVLQAPTADKMRQAAIDSGVKNVTVRIQDVEILPDGNIQFNTQDVDDPEKTYSWQMRPDQT